MCKGRKRGWWCRWKPREAVLLREFEAERRHASGRRT